MRRTRFKILICSLLAVALLGATSQYLGHFHVAAEHVGHAQDPATEHGALEHCTLCLQFDRLPAPPAPMVAPAAWFYPVAIVEAEPLEQLARELPHLWPPARAPPSLDC